jgi:hypothetical protein
MEAQSLPCETIALQQPRLLKIALDLSGPSDRTITVFWQVEQWTVRFTPGICLTEADVLQHPVVKSKKSAALAAHLEDAIKPQPE